MWRLKAPAVTHFLQQGHHSYTSPDRCQQSSHLPRGQPHGDQIFKCLILWAMFYSHHHTLSPKERPNTGKVETKEVASNLQKSFQLPHRVAYGKALVEYFEPTEY